MSEPAPKPMAEYTAHQLSNIFPPMGDDEVG